MITTLKTLNMTKITSLLFLLLMTCAIQAQKDVTTFLGIPVDGFKSEMRKKLIAKGFEPVTGLDFLKGEFNGFDVNVYIATNNNKVYRIMLCDKNTQDEAGIKNRFNKLVSQFENNKRYVTLDKYTLSDDVDISYEMTVNNKNFEAIYYQNINTEKVDSVALLNSVKDELLSKYTKEQLENPTEDMKTEMAKDALKAGMDLIYKKPVWFRICRYLNEYYITMYYDNEYNHANGEDL